MDINRACEVRGLGVVLPVVVGEPTVFGGNCNQISGTFMGNPAFGFGFAIQHRIDSLNRGDELFNVV